MVAKYILCSDCFSDYGLREEAKKFGKLSRYKCKNCGSIEGHHLNKETAEELAWQFFIAGSAYRSNFGAAETIMMNAGHYRANEVKFPVWLQDDANTIGEALRVGFFLYGPSTWKLGQVTPLLQLQNARTRAPVAREIVEKFPKTILHPGTPFFRLRKDVSNPANALEFDSAPKGKSKGRFNSDTRPILYGSESIEICVHECRVTVADYLYVASLEPTRALRLLNLTEEVEEGDDSFINDFESLNTAIGMLFRAAEHSYEAATAIARQAKRSGLDGIIFPSYFHQVTDVTIPNIALFGHPIKEGKLRVAGVNRLCLEKVAYSTRFALVRADDR